jgi:hypothetical protein
MSIRYAVFLTGLWLAGPVSPPWAEPGPGSLSGEAAWAYQAAWNGMTRSPPAGTSWFASLTAEQTWNAHTLTLRLDGHAGAGVGPRPGGCSFSSFASDAAGLAVQEAHLGRRAFRERLEVAAGWLDPTAAFDRNAAANSETEQFLACSLVNNMLIDFPDPSPGFLARVFPERHVGTSLILLVDPSHRERMFEMVEVRGTHPAGTGRIYAWSRGVQGGSALGVGCSLDQRVGSFIFFTRAGYRAILGSSGQTGLSAGAEFSPPLRSPLTGVGLAVEYLSRAAEGNDSFRTVSDFHAEMYLRLRVAPDVSISPDLQWTREWDEDFRLHEILVAGLRTRVAF